MIKRPTFELRITGEKALAEQFVGRAKQLFYKLCDEMANNTDVKTRYEVYELDPIGKVSGNIWIYKLHNINIVTVHAEVPKEKEKPVGRKIWEPWDGSLGYICTDHLWEVSMRTGLYYYPTHFHSSVNDYYGAAPDPVSGYAGIAALTNPSLCNWDWTWPVSDDEVDNMFWVDLGSGFLSCNVHKVVAHRIDPTSYGFYTAFNIIWDNRTAGGSPGDPINPTTNAGASYLEIAAKCWADADPGYGFGEVHVILSSACAFYATDAVGNYWVWFLGIDENLFNDPGFNPPGSNTSFIGDLGFDTGSSGAPIILKLSDYGFTADIVRCGFNFEFFSVNAKGDPTGRDTRLLCDYIDFY